MSRHPGFTYDPANKRARFDCYVPGTSGKLRRRRSVSAATRAEALALWREFLDELAREARGEIAPSKLAGTADTNRVPTLHEFCDAYYEKIAAGLKPNTRRSHGGIIRKRLLPVFGAVPMNEIKSVAVTDFMVVLRRANFAPSYINDCVRVLKMLLNQAVAREVLASYPIKNKLQKEKEPLLRLEMTDAERRAFLAAFEDFEAFAARITRLRKNGPERASEHFAVPRAFGGGMRSDSAAAERFFARFRWLKPLFVVALETGLRKGDLLNLRWTLVDLAAGWIRLVMEKTGFEATIAISSECERALRECLERARASEYVFLNETGRKLSETRVRRAYAIAKELAGISRRCRFHDLRHTFASRLVSRGLNLRVVASALGHVTTAMTERYAKPSEQAMRQIRAALDEQ
ncbi:MAG: site specific recombinase [Acidobacteria bacterium]|nr:site specific recombinase [Acidobacteriota bacterium]